MTMIIGVAVKPKGGRRPFFLMGSDSKRVDLMDIVDGEYVLEVDEDFDKIYKIGEKLLGMAGAFPPEIFEVFPDFLNENICNMENTCEIAFNFVKDYLLQAEIPDGINYLRLRAIIGSMEKGYPQIATLTFDTRDISQSGYILKSQENYGFIVEFIGNTRKTEDLQIKFKHDNQTKNKNLSMLEVEKYAREYLTESVKRYPDKCNQKIVFKKLLAASK